MNATHDIRIVEAEVLKKIHVFKLFKLFGIAYIEKNFPHFLEFVNENNELTFDELERQQLTNLKQFSEMVELKFL
jgi:hypothetical protein